MSDQLLLLQFAQRMSNWLEQAAKRTEEQARSVQNEFPAFARECWREAKNFRIMLADARKALCEESRWGSVTQEWLDMPVDVLEGYGVSLRVVNLLVSSGCQTIGQLVMKTPEQLACIRQLGNSSVQMIQTAARKYLEGCPSSEG